MVIFVFGIMLKIKTKYANKQVFNKLYDTCKFVIEPSKDGKGEGVKEVLNVERKIKLKMKIDIYKPRWKNKEWTFNIFPYLSITKISNLVIAINFGWLFWGITICNDF